MPPSMELNYIPNQNAKNLRAGKTHMIAVIRGSSLNDMFNDLLFYLESLANELGYHIALITVSKTGILLCDRCIDQQPDQSAL
ncbi:MAG: hypothetical protein V8S96_08615 [Lachnospiraceae bacterium]